MELMRRRYVVRMSFLVILASGCASVHTGQDAQQVLAGETPKPGVTKGGLRISGEEDTAHSSLYFGLINLTFENKSDKWINISNLRISFLRLQMRRLKSWSATGWPTGPKRLSASTSFGVTIARWRWGR